MKSILIAIVTLVLSISTASSQVQQDSTNNKMNSKTKDYVTMKNGKVTEYKDGKWSDLTSMFTCTDGSKVSMDGTLTKADGTTQTLKEGDKVYKDGRMTTAKPAPKSDNDKSTYPPK